MCWIMKLSEIIENLKLGRRPPREEALCRAALKFIDATENLMSKLEPTDDEHAVEEFVEAKNELLDLIEGPPQTATAPPI